ncbi:MAG: hypothetical protein ABW110_01255 [Steroidobacteraceae bacterium]
MKPLHYSNGPGFFPEYKIDYHFYLVIHEFFDGASSTREFVNLLENFGKKLNNRASLTLPQAGSYAEVRKNLLRFNWSDDRRQFLKSYEHPILLLSRSPMAIDQFDAKDAQLFLFTDGMANPQMYFTVLNELADEVNLGRDLMSVSSYLGSTPPEATGFMRRLWDGLQLKPGVFGFGIDLKKVATGK